MPTPYYLDDMVEYNRLMAACGCCPAPECGPLLFEAQNRAVEIDYCGYGPLNSRYAYDVNGKVDPQEDDCLAGFDWFQTPAVRVPLYQVKTESVKDDWTLSFTQIVIEYDGSSVETGRRTVTKTASWVETVSIVTEFGAEPSSMSSSNIALGRCSPEDADFVRGSPAGLSASFGTPSSGSVPVTLNWTNKSDEDLPGWYGDWDIEVDGAPSLSEFSMAETDLDCHYFRVRHSMTGRDGGTVYGAWSAYQIFTQGDATCCTAPETNGCTEEPAPASTSNGSGSRFTWSIVDTTGGPSSSGDECDAPLGDNLSGVFMTLGERTQTAADPDDPPDVVSMDPPYPIVTCSDVSDKTVYRGEIDWVSNSAVPVPSGSSGQFSEVGSYEQTVEMALSADINNATTDAAVFTESLAVLTGYSATWGWSDGSPEARWDFGYPETPIYPFESSYTWGRITETRFRWTVAASYTGTWWKVVWDVYFFPDEWIAWRAAYYQWAVEKWAFTSWTGDPGDTPPDPGAAPTEPTAPTMISTDTVWTWTGPGTPLADETFDACDPTADERDLSIYCDAAQATLDAVPAGGAYDEERDAAQAALDACEADLDAIRALTARQSNWYKLTFVTKPASAGTITPTNVRYYCTTNPVHGDIPSYSLEFPTTELPILDPTQRDPSEWADWF